jgi:hypothetical protein
VTKSKLVVPSKISNSRRRRLLLAAAGSDLNEYMLAKLNRVVGRDVENNLRGH